MKFLCTLKKTLLSIRNHFSCPLPPKDWATLLHFCYYSFYLLVTNYLAIKLSVTDNFSVCRNYLAKHRFSFPPAPRWVWQSYLSKGLRLIPYTCGSSRLFSGAVAGEWSAFDEWNLVRKNLYYVLKFTVTCHYGKQSFEGFVRCISPRPEAQRVAPQPTAPTENIYYEIPSGMLEKLLANPYAREMGRCILICT